ncbi:MAG: thioesterase family protein [Myxococcales bacterium]
MLATYTTRLALTFSRSAFKAAVGPLEEVRLPMRVWPLDIDVYLHLNNGRYLTLMDNGRLQFMQRTGLLSVCRRRRWVPVLGGATVEFRRELRSFQTFDLVTRCAWWDEKWFYLEHRMERAGTVHALAWVKPVFKEGRRTVPPAEVLGALGFEGPPPEPSEALRRWAGATR